MAAKTRILGLDGGVVELRGRIALIVLARAGFASSAGKGRVLRTAALLSGILASLTVA